ncbi:uncharacterized protein LOC117133648 [Brassica rapa]|uniref:uncharacterized protein LOC117133648 n=1 Tax=Brassica campestris TaxID=3711 RepID=UPI00142E2D56|nr:uncharacterized protein LOC117133648 [Brassica rapa]
MRAFLWSIAQNALSVGANLQKRGLLSAASCPRCQDIETNTHTFFTCPFEIKVWSCVPLRQEVHIAVDSTFKEAVIKFRSAICFPTSSIAFNVLPWICWAIWTARNTLIFEDKAITPEKTALKKLRLAKEWSLVQGNNRKSSLSPACARISPRQSSRRTEEAGSTTCKTHGAWNSDTKTAGLGWSFSCPPLTSPYLGSEVQTSSNHHS